MHIYILLSNDLQYWKNQQPIQLRYIKSNGLGKNFERQVLKILANTRIGSHYKKP